MKISILADIHELEVVLIDLRNEKAVHFTVACDLVVPYCRAQLENRACTFLRILISREAGDAQ